MALDMADLVKAKLHSEPALWRPSVYNPTPYLRGPRHEYLKHTVKDVKPRILSRTVDRAINRLDVMMMHFEPPALGLHDASPNIYAPNYNITRAREAFLRRKIPRLRRDLDCKRKTMTHALYTLADVLHDPERICEAVREGIPSRVTELLKDKQPWVRERALKVLEILANSAVGREAVIEEPEALNRIKLLMFDEISAVRFRAALVLRMMAFFRMGSYDMDEADIAPFLIYVLRWESDNCIIAVHLNSLKLLLELDETKEACITHGAFDILEQLMRKDHSEVACGALEVMHRLGTCVAGEKHAELERRLVHSNALRQLLVGDDVNTAAAAAKFLFCLTVSPYGKIAAFQNGLHVPLLKLARRNDCRRCQLAAFQALTNMAGYNVCNATLRGENLDDIEVADNDVVKIRGHLLALLK